MGIGVEIGIAVGAGVFEGVESGVMAGLGEVVFCKGAGVIVGVGGVLPRFDLFEDPRSNLAELGAGVATVSMILAVCGRFSASSFDGAPNGENKNKLLIVASPVRAIMIRLVIDEVGYNAQEALWTV